MAKRCRTNNKTRHNWLNLSNNRVLKCTRCGCIKEVNKTSEMVTKYYLNNIEYLRVPECKSNYNDKD